MALIEQIRQQQLAAALESRLDSQSFSAMQAAMLMNKLKAAETSKLLAAASSNTTGSTASTAAFNSSLGKGQNSDKKNRGGSSNNSGKSKNLAMGDKLNKNTVASLLAKSRELAASAGGLPVAASSSAKLTPEELEKAERSWSSQPELTIEPIFRSLKPDSRYLSFSQFSRISGLADDMPIFIKERTSSKAILLRKDSFERR